ncbi:MAG: hypothetical protein AAFR49_20290 [Pseudomonadota bacterium]
MLIIDQKKIRHRKSNERWLRFIALRLRPLSKALATIGALTSEVDLSRFDAAPLIAFIAAKETNYGNETDGRIPR